MTQLQKILYVEDDPDIRAIAQFALEELGGFTVAACACGSEALKRAQTFAPQLLILDVMMPEMDGPTTLSRLRGQPGTDSTPAIFMTAKVQPQEVSHYRSLGAVEVISKPFDPMTLSETVQGIWGQCHG